MPSINNGTLHLTTIHPLQAASAFYNAPQQIGQFTAGFVYRYAGTQFGNPFGPADGFAFVLQNSAAGAQALGAAGSGLGYFFVTPSVGVDFNLYTGSGQPEGTNLGIEGSSGIYSSVFPVQLTSGDPIAIALHYDGSFLTESLTDQVTGASFQTSYLANLPAAAGSSTAYVGFTAGTGGGDADQSINDFHYSGAPVPEASTTVSFGLLALGLGGMIVIKRRQASSAA